MPATCRKCAGRIRRNRQGTWVHIEDDGRRMSGVGHGAVGPCRTPGKRVYPNKREAAVELESLRHAEVFEEGQVYYCGSCKGYHLTSQPLTRSGRHGAATGSLSTHPALREHLNRLGQEYRASREQDRTR